MDDPLFTSSGVARLLGISRATVEAAHSRGRLKAATYLDGKRPVFTKAAVIEWRDLISAHLQGVNSEIRERISNGVDKLKAAR